MGSNRKRRARIHFKQREASHRRRECEFEDQLLDRMAPVGREFGSPDFDRLMEEDQRLGRGVFDPSLRRLMTEPVDCEPASELPDLGISFEGRAPSTDSMTTFAGYARRAKGTPDVKTSG